MPFIYSCISLVIGRSITKDNTSLGIIYGTPRKHSIEFHIFKKVENIVSGS